MDAIEILQRVARAYANLKSLSVELRTIAESGDDGASNRSERRAKAWFEAPNKVRIEDAGMHGGTTVVDGVDRHFYHGHANRYSKQAAMPDRFLPGVFRLEHIFRGSVFLFLQIADQVASAAVLDEGSDSLRLSVTYEAPPLPRSFWRSSPVEYWIDPRTHLVARVEGESSRTAQGTTRVTRHILFFENAIIDGPLPPETFEYTPPPDAVDASGEPGMAGGIVGAGGFRRGDGQDRQVVRGFPRWVDGTLVESEKLSMNGIELTLERRLAISPDSRELRVFERIVSPAGETVHEFVVPLRPDSI